MRARAGIVALVVCAQIIGAAGRSEADTGWAYRNGSWVHYTFRFEGPKDMRGQGIVALRATQRLEAVAEAALGHQAYLRRLERLLVRARAVLSLARLQVGWFGDAMACIGLHEEGGRNSAAGYFGFVYPPSSYPEPGPTLARSYGDSWLGISYSDQIRVAWSLYGLYSWSPWTTAAACGL